MPVLPPLRHLAAEEVEAAMPPLDERLRLAELTMVALATPGAAELPSKIGVHPRPAGSFAHAMPAHLRGGGPEADLLGMKWVTGFSGNAARGLAAISAVVVLNDPATGVPTAVIDGGPITAQRTAAVTGVAIQRFAPDPAAIPGGTSDRRPTVALIGAGVQGRSHLAVIGATVPGCELRILDRHPDRAAALVDLASRTPGIDRAAAADDLAGATEGADVVVTAASFAAREVRQSLGPDRLAPRALVVAVDYATLVSADVARGADLFIVDERGQFLANREAGQFDDYPDPAATLGEAVLAATPRPAGRVLVTHLGVGLADVVFGAAVLRRATELGLGRELPR